MHEAYALTCLTPERVARKTGFLSWESQPSLFKRYPDFLFRYKLRETGEIGRLLSLARSITSELQVGGKPYRRLNTPSAGNLHPIELYVQLRGYKGILGGIYHIDVLHGELVLINDLESDGIEPCFGMEERFKGAIFIISVVPFRSSWKYGKRAWRYCWLDAGHQAGALEAAAAVSGQELTNMLHFEGVRLDDVLGFGSQEHAVAAYACGEGSGRRVKALSGPLMQVAPTDYCEPDATLAQWMRQRMQPAASSPMLINGADVDERAIVNRRSARSFEPQPLDSALVQTLMMRYGLPRGGVGVMSALLRCSALDAGVYDGTRLVKAGRFDRELSALLVNQRFVESASMLLFICAEEPDESAHFAAGKLGHELYLSCTAAGLGCSGIGAFYDEALREFLQTGRHVLYVVAIGRAGQE